MKQEFKVGDPVKVLREDNNVPRDTVGKIYPIVDLFHADEDGPLTHVILEPKGAHNYRVYYLVNQVELITQPQQPMKELKLEDVYTVAPQKELVEVLIKAGSKVGFTCNSPWDGSEYGKFPYIKIQGDGIDGYDSLSDVEGKQEVSIPQFLTLLEEYGKRTPDPVKVVLNDLLEAVVDSEKGQVKVYYGHPSKDRPENIITYTQLRELQEALKGGGHGFKDQDYVVVPSGQIGNALMAYAQQTGIKMGNDFGGVGSKSSDPSCYVEGDCIKYDGFMWGSSNSFGTKLTIDQFLAKCQAKPLPNLAGYEVKKVDGGIKVGCQPILQEKLEELFQAINQTK